MKVNPPQQVYQSQRYIENVGLTPDPDNPNSQAPIIIYGQNFQAQPLDKLGVFFKNLFRDVLIGLPILIGTSQILSHTGHAKKPFATHGVRENNIDGFKHILILGANTSNKDVQERAQNYSQQYGYTESVHIGSEEATPFFGGLLDLARVFIHRLGSPILGPGHGPAIESTLTKFRELAKSDESGKIRFTMYSAGGLVGATALKKLHEELAPKDWAKFSDRIDSINMWGTPLSRQDLAELRKIMPENSVKTRTNSNDFVKHLQRSLWQWPARSPAFVDDVVNNLPSHSFNSYLSSQNA
jgi:hypothetical protein